MSDLFTRRAVTDAIVVHCSATPEDRDIGAKEIRQWHREKGWVDIGYHAVIRRNGTVEFGRPLWAVGAHVEDHNKTTIGICLVGGVDANDIKKAEDNYTPVQKESLHRLIVDMLKQYPSVKTILGHRDYAGVKKACPCFDVRPWWDSVRLSLPEGVTPNVYRVVTGDTYWAIARKLGVNVFDLMEANLKVPAFALKPGTLLSVPV